MNNVDMRTNYLGLELSSPLVPSASPLSRSLDTARALEDAGAGALVMFSLFEEELHHEEEQTHRFLIHQDIGHSEASSFLPFHGSYQRGIDRYLEQLSALKQHLDIPVIASLNGVSLDGWVRHGRDLQQAGANALELNVYYVAADIDQSGSELEARYLELIRELRAQVSIPIAVKLSSQFSSVMHFIKQVEEAGADGVVLFNRFYQPDIDLDTLQVTPQLRLSTSVDNLLVMRWIALLYGRVNLSLAATGGIHDAQDALKMLLAGATVTQMCSALLRHGPARLAEVRAGMAAWMDENGIHSVDDLRGRVSQQHAADPAAFERANYLWVLDNYTQSIGVRR